ncbi:MAG: type VI secretion system tip protein VgrG [Polyangiaceae bacterium]|nr:type VI secretion system tip protein VgrG [Polyangiaceae bacterium]
MRTVHEARVSFEGQSSEFLSVRRFRIREALNELWEVHLEVVCTDASLRLGDHVGHPAEMRLFTFGERRFSGVCTRMGLTRVADDGTGLATYELTIRPELWRATQRKNWKLYQHIAIPEIVTQILNEWKIPHELRLSAKYPNLELRTQYGESDYQFFARLLEEAGITLFFEDDGVTPPKVILSDAPHAANIGRAPITYADDTSMAYVSASPFATALSVIEESRPGVVTLRDYDFWRPRLPLYSSSQTSRSEESLHEQFDYLPSGFLTEIPPGERVPMPGGVPTRVADDLASARFSEAHGERRAKEKLEAMVADRVTVRFNTNVIDLAPGLVFQVLGHPRLDISTTPLLALRMSMEGEVANPKTWQIRSECAFVNVVYRPALITHKPIAHGVHTAMVVGPNAGPAPSGAALSADVTTGRLSGNEEVYVDEHGRVRVQFPWDRYGGFNAQSSIWMRVSQGAAGGGTGLFTIPRIGHEVLVSFVSGDPDNPIIVGRVHNQLSLPPHKLPENKTVSTWKTATSPGGGGFNELRMDDAAGREHVYFQAERDMDRLVKRDSKEAIGRDENKYVERDRSAAVGGSETRFINRNGVDATGLNRVSHTGIHRVSTVGVEDNTFVGSKWSVTIARGMARKLARTLDGLANDLGDVLRTTATSVLGRLPGDPLGPIAEASLTGFAGAAYSRFKDAIGAIEGFENEEGPLPTSIQMVDRQIKLTTGESTILLDGPNITFLAAGKIAFHSKDDILITSESEVAVAGRKDAALVSAEKDVIVQAGKNVQLNPYRKSGTLSQIKGRGGEIKKAPEEVTLCTLHEGGTHPLGKDGVCHHGPKARAGGSSFTSDSPELNGDVYTAEAADELPFDDALRDTFAKAVYSGQLASLYPDSAPNPDSLFVAHNRVVDNMVAGRDILDGITPPEPSTLPVPGYAGATAALADLADAPDYWATVGDARAYFGEVRNLYKSGQ